MSCSQETAFAAKRIGPLDLLLSLQGAFAVEAMSSACSDMSSELPTPTTAATALAQQIGEIVNAASNEAQFRHEAEKALERACLSLGIAWTPFQLERTLRAGSRVRFVDVAHGAVIVEYEAPGSFRGREAVRLRHAKEQAEEYASLLSQEEGRSIESYLVVVWDGAHVAFGRCDERGVGLWERLTPFDAMAAERLLEALRQQGRPIVHPLLLAQIAGPESFFGAALIPLFFEALRVADDSTAASKTKLLFAEWRRLFGQVVGVQSEGLRRLLAKQGAAHGQQYEMQAASYLFALHTYIGLLAKIVAACALPNAGQDMRDRSVPIDVRIDALESGSLFEHAGIVNMLSGDFFSWYVDDPLWPRLAGYIDALTARLSGVDFDVSRKSAASTRDLFKGIYESFVPRALRHALGEFYTPDWLAEHALNVAGWSPASSLLDPTCGSGTFVLEALRRRLAQGRPAEACLLLDGLHGFDLNPLAVLTAKGSLAVFIAPYLDAANPVRLPIYLADAVNPAAIDADGLFSHVLQTEVGPRSFRLPAALIARQDFFRVFARVRELVDAHRQAVEVGRIVSSEFGLDVYDSTDGAAILGTIETLCELHARGWNGIWCPILADRFAAGAIGRQDFVCGNPPWVKWSHLPPDYAAFIGPRCRRLGVFSSDTWVGGIESDISTVITFEVIDNFLGEGGKLAFFITGTVFSNESSEGFRQFRLHDGALTCRVLAVEDYDAIAPFDGVSNRPALLLLERGGVTRFPIPYRVWSCGPPGRGRVRSFDNAQSFVQQATCRELSARPVPGGGGSRPWLVGSEDDHEIFVRVLAGDGGQYQARKGVTTDRNGIFWVDVTGPLCDGVVPIRNRADIGRTTGLPRCRGFAEAEHLFPLLRGRGVSAFRAAVDPELRLLLPQRGMHGDPRLHESGPHSFRFLRKFESELSQRSSFRRFQARAGHPYYSLWSTGEYTFSPFKVLWREMGGGGFAAAYVGSINDPVLGKKLVIPDHKLYFIAVATEDEAAYLTALLNAPMVAGAVSAYASQLSLGVSVAEYLHLPRFDDANRIHRELARLALRITRGEEGASDQDRSALDELAHALFPGH